MTDAAAGFLMVRNWMRTDVETPPRSGSLLLGVSPPGETALTWGWVAPQSLEAVVQEPGSGQVFTVMVGSRRIRYRRLSLARDEAGPPTGSPTASVSPMQMWLAHQLIDAAPFSDAQERGTSRLSDDVIRTLDWPDTSLTASRSVRSFLPGGLVAEVNDAVTGFVAEAPSIARALPEIRRQILRFFGEGASQSLRVARDPDGGKDRLVVEVSTPVPADQALEALARFDDEWWLESELSSEGLLTITVR